MTRALPPIFLFLAACRVDHVIASLSEGGSTDLSDSSGATSAATSSVTETSASETGASETGTTGGGCMLDEAPPCEGVNDPWKAIGLGCAATPISGPTIDAPEPSAYRVAAQFGNAYWSPREGAQLLVLSTGTLPIPDVNGRLSVPAGSAQPGTDNEAQNGGELPAPLAPVPGSEVPYQECDGVNDCSHSLPAAWTPGTAVDMIVLGAQVTAPVQAAGFALDVAWLSAEFPERADQPDGDLAIVWINSEAFTGNLLTVDGAALSAMGARSRVVEGELVGDHPSLQSTGFEGVEGPPCDYGWAVYTSCPVGGALDWTPLRGPVGPGETFTLTIALLDRWDALGDTVLLLDAWRWTCDGCALGETCGL